MSNIINAIGEYLKPYYTKILIAFVILVFLIAAMYGYNKYAKPVVDVDSMTDIANANRRNKVADLYFFHVDWCPHCKTALGPWNSFAADYEGREVNGVTVKCHGINCTDTTDTAKQEKIKEYIATYDIKSYPTVILVLGDGKKVEFDAKIERDSLSQFVNTMLTDK